MKKTLLASAAVVVLAAAGGSWYVLNHRDPLQQAKLLLNKGDLRAAGLQLRSAVRDDPSSAEAHALLAQYDLAVDDPIAAEHEIKQAMALHWDNASSLAVLSQAYMRQRKWSDLLQEIPTSGGTPEQTAFYLMARAVAERGTNNVAAATKTLAEAERLAPQNAEVHLVAARFALADGQLDGALDEVDRSLAIEPARVESLQLKSQLLLAKGDQAGATAAITRAIDAAPARADLRVERAALFLNQNDEAKAKADVAAVLSSDPKNAPAHFLQAVLLTRQSNFTEADQQIQQIDPVIDRFQRGLYFKALIKARLGQNAQAEDAAMTYVNRVPTDPDGIRLLAQIELSTRHPDRAIPYLVKAIGAGQRDADTLDLLGRAYAMNGNKREADTVLQQASQIARSPAEYTRLASARLQVGDLSGAASDLQHSLEIAPSQPAAAEALIATSLRLGQLDRAQQALDQLRQQSGDTEIVGNLTGLLQLAKLDTTDALNTFADVAKRFPDSAAPRLNQAKVLLQLGRPDEALTVLAGLLDRNPAQPDALALYAQTLLNQGRGPEAIAAAERARVSRPGDAGLVNGEAQLYARMQQYDKALALIDGAKVDGKIPVPLLPTLASIQLAAGQNDAARQTLSDLVAADPNNVTAVLSQIDVLTRLHDYAAARSAADNAIQRQPTSLPLLQARVRIDLIDKGLDTAMQTADRLNSNSAYQPASASLKGGLLMGTQHFKEAAAAFQSEFQKSPSSVLAVALAQAQNAAGDANGAATTLLKWQSDHPDDPAVAQLLGTLDITAHRYDSSERNLQIALRAQPNDLVALNNLAWIYQQKGDKRAREYAQRAFELAPTPEVTDTFAWILLQGGDPAKALPLLKAASTGRPQNQSIKYHYAVALKDTGQRQDAIDLLRPMLASPEPFDDRPAAQTLLTELTANKP